jgi:hypothetical protein
VSAWQDGITGRQPDKKLASDIGFVCKSRGVYSPEVVPYAQAYGLLCCAIELREIARLLRPKRKRRAARAKPARVGGDVVQDMPQEAPAEPAEAGKTSPGSSPVEGV